MLGRVTSPAASAATIPGQPDLPPTPEAGLDDAEVARRRAAGLGNRRRRPRRGPTPRSCARTSSRSSTTSCSRSGIALVARRPPVRRPRLAGRHLDQRHRRHRPGDPRQADARPDRAADAAHRDGRARPARRSRSGPRSSCWATSSSSRPGDQIVLDGRLVAGRHRGRRVAAHGRERRRPQARRRRGVQRELRDDRRRALRRRGGRVEQLRQPDHGRRAVVPARDHAAPGRDQPRHPGRARDRPLPRGAARRARPRPAVGAGRRGRRRDAARGPRAQRPVRVDRRRLRPRRDPDPAVRGAGPAGELRSSR